MLALLIHAAPLSEKCKRSGKIENGVQATLVPLQSSSALNASTVVPAVSSSRFEPQIFKMSSATSTVVPTSTRFSEDRFVPLLQDTSVAVRRGCTTVATRDGLLRYASPRLQDSCGESDTLKWYEARRIGSEPVGLQSWPSTASLECGERDVEDDDDVFTERSFSYENGSVYPEDECYGEDSVHSLTTNKYV